MVSFCVELYIQNQNRTVCRITKGRGKVDLTTEEYLWSPAHYGSGLYATSFLSNCPFRKTEHRQSTNPLAAFMSKSPIRSLLFGCVALPLGDKIMQHLSSKCMQNTIILRYAHTYTYLSYYFRSFDECIIIITIILS